MRRLSQKILGATSAFALVSVLTTVVTQAQSYRYDYSYDAVDSAAGLGFLGAYGLVWICVCCFSLIVPIICAVVVYRDAKKNNVENGVLWAVLTFFFNIIGLLVYFLAIKPEAVRKNSGLNNMVNNVKEKVETKVEEVKEDMNK